MARPILVPMRRRSTMRNVQCAKYITSKQLDSDQREGLGYYETCSLNIVRDVHNVSAVKVVEYKMHEEGGEGQEGREVAFKVDDSRCCSRGTVDAVVEGRSPHAEGGTHSTRRRAQPEKQ